MTKAYTSDDIEVLTDREHVRLRTQIYLGNTTATSYSIPLFIDNQFIVKEIEFIPAVYKAVGEIIDNSLDEFAQNGNVNPHLTIEAHPILGTYTISDNGRGIPIDKHKSGKYTPEVALGSLRAGRNFDDDKEAGVIGQNGVGSACTCFCSTDFSVDIHRDKKRYRQTFTDGALHVSKPVIRKTTVNKTGTSVNFQLDNQVFSNITLPNELLENRAIEIALTNPNVLTEYNGTKYKFRRGFDDIVKQISTEYFKFQSENMEFFVIFDIYEGLDEQIFSWVNSSLLFDGGLCNTQFLNAFYDKTIDNLKSIATKNKCTVTKNDVRQNLLVIGNLKLSDPNYDAQSKTRLTGPNLRKEMAKLVSDHWTAFSRKNKQWLQCVFERAIIRHNVNANKEALKEHNKNLKLKVPVDGLVDATSKIRMDCQILVTEGDSAASMIDDVREPRTTASLPLRGKVNNVYGATPAQLLSMGKITNLLKAVGLVPGKRALRSELRYGRIVIATDADVDGGDIFTLLINLLYQFWPELFDPEYQPFVYRLVAPNVCLSKGTKRIHFSSRVEYEKKKNRYKGWEVRYYKGLGSMLRVDWDMILSGKTDTLIPIIDDGNMKDTLQLLFGPDADARKTWLQGI